jgi:hypothetical protein
MIGYPSTAIAEEYLKGLNKKPENVELSGFIRNKCENK